MLKINVPLRTSACAGFFLLYSCSRLKATSPRKISLKSCNFPQKWNLPLQILFPFRHFAANFSPKFEGQATSPQPKKNPELWKRK